MIAASVNPPTTAKNPPSVKPALPIRAADVSVCVRGALTIISSMIGSVAGGTNPRSSPLPRDPPTGTSRRGAGGRRGGGGPESPPLRLPRTMISSISSTYFFRIARRRAILRFIAALPFAGAAAARFFARFFFGRARFVAVFFFARFFRVAPFRRKSACVACVLLPKAIKPPGGMIGVAILFSFGRVDVFRARPPIPRLRISWFAVVVG